MKHRNRSCHVRQPSRNRIIGVPGGAPFSVIMNFVTVWSLDRIMLPLLAIIGVPLAQSQNFLQHAARDHFELQKPAPVATGAGVSGGHAALHFASARRVVAVW